MVNKKTIEIDIIILVIVFLAVFALYKFTTPAYTGFVIHEGSQDIDFNNPEDYTYDDSLIQISGGEVSLIQQEHNFSNNLIAEYALDETAYSDLILDDSVGDNDGAIDGATWEDGNFNEALEFDGNNDYVDLGNFDINGDELTILAWFKADDFGTTDARIISKATSQSEQDHYWMLSTVKSGSKYRLRFRLRTDDDTETLVASSGNLDDDIWIHAAVVYNGTNMIIYKDAEQVGIKSKTGNISTDNEVSVRMGDNPGTHRKRFDGLIDDVAIYNKALTQQEIENIYESELTADANMVSLWDFNNDAEFPVDTLGINNGTVRGNLDINEAGKINNAATLDGDEASIQIERTGHPELDPEEVTVMTWVKNTARDDNYMSDIVCRSGGSNGCAYRLYLNDGLSNDKLGVQVRTENGKQNQEWEWSSMNEEWFHFAMSFKQGTMIMYLNGVNVSSWSDLGTTLDYRSQYNGDDLYIGSDSDDNYFTGLIDEVAVYNRVLTPLEVNEIYSTQSQESKDYGTYYQSSNITTQNYNLNENSFSGIFSEESTLNGQQINYYYSLDSQDYNLISSDNISLNNASTIKFKAELLTDITSTPTLSSLSLTYDYDIPCEEDWQENYLDCLPTDLKLKYYTDSNSCGTISNLPSDNSTYEACDYIVSDEFNTTLPDNLTDIENLILEIPQYGFINFTDLITIDNPLDLDTYIEINATSITIDSTALPELNKSATLTLKNLNFNNPLIYRDGVLCNDCNLINYENGILIFDVPHFTEYSIGEGPYCGDGICQESCGSCSSDCGACPPDGGSGGKTTFIRGPTTTTETTEVTAPATQTPVETPAPTVTTESPTKETEFAEYTETSNDLDVLTGQATQELTSPTLKKRINRSLIAVIILNILFIIYRTTFRKKQKEFSFKQDSSKFGIK